MSQRVLQEGQVKVRLGSKICPECGRRISANKPLCAFCAEKWEATHAKSSGRKKA